VACEGRFAAFVPEDLAEQALGVLREHSISAGACRIGHVTEQHTPKVLLKSSIGALRILDMASGEQLPRIC